MLSLIVRGHKVQVEGSPRTLGPFFSVETPLSVWDK